MGDWLLVATVFVTLWVFWKLLNWSFDTIDRAMDEMRREERE